MINVSKKRSKITAKKPVIIEWYHQYNRIGVSVVFPTRITNYSNHLQMRKSLWESRNLAGTFQRIIRPKGSNILDALKMVRGTVSLIWVTPLMWHSSVPRESHLAHYFSIEGKKEHVSEHLGAEGEVKPCTTYKTVYYHFSF